MVGLWLISLGSWFYVEDMFLFLFMHTKTVDVITPTESPLCSTAVQSRVMLGIPWNLH